MPSFSPVVAAHWERRVGGDVLFRDERLTLVTNANLDASERVTVLWTATDGRTSVAVTPDVADAAGLVDLAARGLSEYDLRAALVRVDLVLHDPDLVHHLDDGARAALLGEADAPGVRRLTAEDATLFADFESAAPEQDLDDAYVELDHWAVFGAVDDDGRLVAAASAYPWGGSALADVGVLTLPDARGRGHGRAVVRALARHALHAGHEPQYRCQPDNAASVALAAAAGLTLFGRWEVVTPDAPADGS
ncbi:GNAT family N-acetyltransferase [Cellulosimicrobium sp. 22601]|uniref:GNAT family N-acetyltransferase n=1 Tax=unclassified Cellulosimicrobium TaxID=2624466 RepID=UPI003F84E2FD